MHHVIYVPGLSDDKNGQGQRKVVEKWRKFGVEPHFYHVRWRTGGFDEKFAGLLELIDRLAKTGSVSLVGVSAGASMVLLAFAERPKKVDSVVTICGKIYHPESVDAHYYLENPAFKESLLRVQKVLPRLEVSRILNLRPLWDGHVPVADGLIPGAAQKIIPTIGHGFSVVVAIVFYGATIARFVKAHAR